MSDSVKVSPVTDQLNFSNVEKDILQFWDEIDAFKTCLKQSKNKPR